MIVKNEEAMLARCLSSVKGADDIIIVDTGSTDRTKEIAAQFTDKIFDFEWCDNFAAARNFALGKADCFHWILSLDADEYLEEGGIEKIREFLSGYKKDAVGLHMKAVNNDFYGVRLFRNDETIYWVGKIHEAINVLDYDCLDVGITYETSPAHAFDPDRNFRILKSVAAEKPEDPRTLFYLAMEYGYRNDWKNCIETMEKYVTVSQFLKEKAEAYFVLALAYWYSQEGDKARASCLNALCINANFKAAARLMGHMSFERNKVQWDRLAETATNEETLFARVNFLSL